MYFHHTTMNLYFLGGWFCVLLANASCERALSTMNRIYISTFAILMRIKVADVTLLCPY